MSAQAAELAFRAWIPSTPGEQRFKAKIAELEARYANKKK